MSSWLWLSWLSSIVVVFVLLSMLLNCRRLLLVNRLSCRYVKSWLKELAMSGVDATGSFAPIGSGGDSMAFGAVLCLSSLLRLSLFVLLSIKIIVVVIVVVEGRKHYRGRRPRSNLAG